MPYSYTRKQALQVRIIELVAYVLLFPLILFSKKPRDEAKKILLIEPFQMGDILSLTPMIGPLLHKFPNSHIYVLTKPSSGTFLELDNRIKGIIKLDFPWSDYGHKKFKLRRMIKLLMNIWLLRKDNFDLGIDTRGDIRSQILLLVAGCKSRVGYLNYLHSNVFVKGLLLTNPMSISKRMHRYEWNLELLTKVGLNEDELFPICFPTFIPRNLDSGHRIDSTLIHVGGGWKYKHWKEEKWAHLIKQLSADSNKRIIVIGGPGEKEIVENVEAKCGKLHNVTFSTTSLQELVSLIFNCSQMIGLDSGPINLAVCMDKPVISLFGPGDSAMWYPLNKKGKYIHFKEKFPCSPCFQTECFYPEHNCMDEIAVNKVLDLIQ